jgi:hypothetical protein
VLESGKGKEEMLAEKEPCSRLVKCANSEKLQRAFATDTGNDVGKPGDNSSFYIRSSGQGFGG